MRLAAHGLAFLLTLLGPVAMAAEEAVPAAGASQPAIEEGEQAFPVMEVAEPVLRTGEVMQGEVISHAFEVRNIGSAPLILESAHPTCACTVVSFDPVIAPAGRGEVRVRVNTGRLGVGPRTSAVVVLTNDPEHRILTLKVETDVQALGMVLPIKVFITTKADRELKGEFLVRAHPTNRFKVREVTSDIDVLAFEVTHLKTEEDADIGPVGGYLPRKGDYKVEIRFSRPPTTMRLHGKVTIRTTSKKTPELYLPFDALLIEPPPESFGPSS
jgi:hypothetical protein